MAAFDFADALRWSRFDPRRTLARREDDRLPFLREDSLGGHALLLDTCVYIDQLQKRAPDIIQNVIRARVTNHSTVAIQELMHAVGVLDPKDSRTSTVIDAIRLQIDAMRPHRVFVPDADTLGRAALLSGILCRLQGYSNDGRMRALHDCVLFVQAQKLGLAVLTGNVVDFDILLQLLPSGHALFYRTRT